MKIAFIQPLDYLVYDYTDYHMCLTHLVLDYPHYADFYRHRAENGDYVILDNSLIELDEALDLSVVLKAAELVLPDEIVLPDCYLDGPGTLYEIRQALKQLKDTPYKLQAVCHGKSVREWKECWDVLQWLPEVRCIGIPKVTTTFFDGGRPEAVRYALDNNQANKEIHLLGMWGDVTELKEYNVYEASKIRGMDSSITFHSTIENYSYKKNQTKKPDYKIDLVKSYKVDGKLLLENQQQVLEWVQI